MRNNSSERDFFSKHVELIHLADLEVLKHFSEKSCYFISLLFSFILSCLVLSSLLFRLVLSVSLSLSSFSVSLSLSPCDVVVCCCVVLLCCVVLCRVVSCCVVLCCVVLCVRVHVVSVVWSLWLWLWLWSWCVCVCGVVWHAENLRHVCAWCRYTRGRVERTHGDVLNLHTGGSKGGGVIVSSAPDSTSPP